MLQIKVKYSQFMSSPYLVETISYDFSSSKIA